MHGVSEVWDSRAVLGICFVLAGVDCWWMQHFDLFVCSLPQRGLGVVRQDLDLTVVNCLLCPFEIVELGYRVRGGGPDFGEGLVCGLRGMEQVLCGALSLVTELCFWVLCLCHLVSTWR